MAAWAFNKDFHDYEQIAPFWDAYMARFHELESAGRYPYNDDFRGCLGGTWATERDEDTAVYLCQKRRHILDDEAKVAAAIAEGGFVPIERVDAPLKCASVIYYKFENEETGFKRWDNVRLVPGLTGMAVMMPRARTRGINLFGGRVLVNLA